MEYAKLGSSGIDVSNICLGSMTWGVQNSQQDADQQIEFAIDKGINFIDTAELYPVPPSGEKYGDTERIIGNWLARNKAQRQNLVLATKIAGNGLPWIRNAEDISGPAIIKSVDDSLQRLQTDYIDLYQLHWPNRTSPHFAKHRPNQVRFSEVSAAHETAVMHEILDALQTCIDAGKVKHCGLSDDTTWGINQYLKLSEKYQLPKMVSIQNEFSLLHSKDWPYLIENCIHENIAYLPWSPLAGGALSGKYLNGARPEGSRWTMSQRNGLFRDSEQSMNAVAEYKTLAEKNGYSAAQLALAWCKQVDGVTSTIIGATSIKQLNENINAFEITLDDVLLSEIDEILKRFPAPF
ncbi:aldo/keto reductase [Psychrosphaera ytuae]|uniref:Aldo/keto reductase n=1 Tax=Psychrosphaera ytuae TaxID=2820710 RepID=A0A975HIP7_9GAMM|nr:aldo/keto reductase [Psychrosphaera ytuae]QTH64486.1 aldo/keto reductase [Psychrosphaera ytuae]